MKDPGKHSQPDLGSEIIGYLRTHPEAADTVDGILRWWLPAQRNTSAKDKLQQALLDLVQQGVIEEIVQGNGSRLYRLHLVKNK
jgi:hypothetical protein